MHEDAHYESCRHAYEALSWLACLQHPGEARRARLIKSWKGWLRKLQGKPLPRLLGVSKRAKAEICRIIQGKRRAHLRSSHGLPIRHATISLCGHGIKTSAMHCPGTQLNWPTKENHAILSSQHSQNMTHAFTFYPLTVYRHYVDIEWNVSETYIRLHFSQRMNESGYIYK